MKYALLTALYCVFLSLTVSAQDAEGPDTLNISAWSFGDQVRVRKAPGESGAVTGKLAAGEPVTIYFVTEEISMVNGLKFPWVKIKKQDGSEGYVWSGLLARAAADVTLPKLGEGLLMFGPVEDTGSVVWAFRMIPQDGKIREFRVPGNVPVSQTEHPWLMEYSMEESALSSEQASGLSPALYLIQVKDMGCACACWSTEYFFSWSGKEFRFAFEMNTESSPYADSDYELLYPGGGKANKIVIKKTQDEADENGEMNSPEVTLEKYLWNGVELTRMEE